jgi:cobalt-zinc-cadmium efflux system membrane fusion protein
MLSDEKIAAEKDFLKAESEYKSLQAEVEGMKALLRMNYIEPAVIENGNIVPFLSVKSPISGTVTMQELMLGQHVEPLETAMEVVSTSKLRLRLEVFETSIADVAVGQQVSFATPNLPERKFPAIMSHIGKSVSSDSRTVECFATIADKERKFFMDNMYVEAFIITWEREALAIPEQALIREHERDYVLILIEENGDQMIFRQVPVETGVTRQGHTEILDRNLSDVLIDGVFSLRTDE